MKRRILFVVNPIAGTKKKDGLEEFLKREAERDQVEYRIFQTARTTNAYALQHQAEEFNATDIVACGGDGTVNLVAAAVKDTHTRIGIIPVGSGNGLARAANIPLKPMEAYNVIRTGKVVETDTFTVNRQFACMLAGVGFDAAVAERFAQHHKRGLMTYTTQTLIEFFKSHPYQFEICLDGFAFFTDAFFISVANSNQFGNNVTIAPLASISDGLLDVIIVQRMPKSQLPFALLKQVSGNNKLRSYAEQLKKDNVLYYQAKNVQIRNLQLAPLHIDGDPVSTSEEISIRMAPQSIRLLVP